MAGDTGAADDQPQKSEQAWNDERDAPSPAKVDRQDQERRDGAADRRAAVEQGDGHAALAVGEPLGNRLAGAGPVGCFAHAEQKAEEAKACDAVATEVISETIEYHVTLMVRPRRVPSDRSAGPRPSA